MSQLSVTPGVPLRGRAKVPGDKSISHRALLLGAIAEGSSRIDGFLTATDCQATLGVVRALGVEVEQLTPSTLVVHGRGLGGLKAPNDVLNCCRSGTAMRMLAGLLAGQPFLSILTGDDQLRRRPMARVVEPLRLMGATVLGHDGGNRPPLAIQGGYLHGLDYSLPVASAQVKSAILLAGLYADGPTTLYEPGPARDHTERMLRAMGCELEASMTVDGALEDSNWAGWEPGQAGQDSANRRAGGCRLRVTPGQRLQALDVRIPGDFSSAAFLIVAATLVEGSEVTIEGVSVNPTRTGLLDALRAMGADITLEREHMAGGEPVADLVVRASELHGTEIGGDLVVRMIDELPILAVAATQARGDTIVRDAAELRVKETDRIATTVQQLCRLGYEVEPRPDGFVVHGPGPRPGAFAAKHEDIVVQSHGDHRLAMALTVAGLIAQDVTRVLDVACIGDSFPGFTATMASIGANITCE